MINFSTLYTLQGGTRAQGNVDNLLAQLLGHEHFPLELHMAHGWSVRSDALVLCWLGISVYCSEHW